MEQAKAVIAELAKHGIKGELRMQRRGHPRVYFMVDGKERFYVVPGSGSDSRRGVENALADIRRMIGVTAARKKSTRVRAHRPKAPAVVPPAPVITVKPDPFRVLVGTQLMRDALRLQADRAWRSLWADACLRTCGATSIAGSFRTA